MGVGGGGAGGRAGQRAAGALRGAESEGAPGPGGWVEGGGQGLVGRRARNGLGDTRAVRAT